MNRDNYASKAIDFLGIVDAYKTQNLNEAHVQMLNDMHQSIVESIKRDKLGKIVEAAVKNPRLAVYIRNKAIKEAIDGVADDELSKDDLEGLEKSVRSDIDDEIKSAAPDFTEIVDPEKRFELLKSSMCMTVGNRLLGEPTTVIDNEKIEPFRKMKDLLNYIDDKLGFFFEEDDFYCNFAKAAADNKSPALCARKAITSDVVQGSEALSKWFGPNGHFSGYLYKPDGTAKLEPSKKLADEKTGLQEEIDVVDKFPVIHLFSVVDVKDSDKDTRGLVPDDFKGTEVHVIR